MTLLILRLYNHYHIRNDFSNVKVIDNDKYKQMDEEDKRLYNWYIPHKKFIFWNFKTSKTTNLPVVLKVKPALKLLLTRWLKYNTSGWFLINQSGRKLSPNLITKILQSTYHRYIGKRIGTSLLRHIYISHYFANDSTYLEKKEMADRFLHSVATQQKVYRKLEDKTDAS